jgi:hypothetical protein
MRKIRIMDEARIPTDRELKPKEQNGNTILAEPGLFEAFP